MNDFRASFAASQIQISKSALKHNLDFIKSKIGKNSRLSSVVKGNAYGHDISVFVPLAEQFGVDHFSVFSADEAWQVKKCVSDKSDVMIMGSIPDEALGWAVENDVEITVFELERLQILLETAHKIGKKARFHLELETGMNRTGVEKKQLPLVSDILKKYPGDWQLEGLSTHYAGAESIGNYLRVKRQIKRYRSAVEEVRELGLNPKKLHTACSAAAFSYPETILDMARIGIAQYGYWPSRETYMHHYLKKPGESDPLKRVLSWTSKVMSIKEVAAGEFIGYGTSYLAGIPTRVATVPVGYSHGFSRNLSNLGRVIVGGQRTSVVGVINMNMMLIDVTEVPYVQRGDEVVIIGDQEGQTISVSSFSELSQNLNYETLVRLPSDIPRVVVE
ncbi:MAG: alanine racemase [Balneolales bacterium]|nr:alanine racemase [Balneolales bacterium]